MGTQFPAHPNTMKVTLCILCVIAVAFAAESPKCNLQKLCSKSLPEAFFHSTKTATKIHYGPFMSEAYGNEVLVTDGPNHRLLLFTSTSSGIVEKEIKLPNEIGHSRLHAALDGTKIYLTDDRLLYELSYSGKILHKTTVRKPRMINTVSYHDGQVYIGSGGFDFMDKHIYKYDPSSHKITVWKTPNTNYWTRMKFDSKNNYIVAGSRNMLKYSNDGTMIDKYDKTLLEDSTIDSNDNIMAFFRGGLEKKFTILDSNLKPVCKVDFPKKMQLPSDVIIDDQDPYSITLLKDCTLVVFNGNLVVRFFDTKQLLSE